MRVCLVALALMAMTAGCGVNPPVKSSADSPVVSDAEFAKLATVMKVPLPVLIAGRTDEAVKIDGDLSKPVWQNAKPVGDFTFVDDSSMKSEYPTTVRALYDNDYLYLAFSCQEPNSDKLVMLAKERDGNIYSDDRIEFLLDPLATGRDYYDFALTAGNVQLDSKCRSEVRKVTLYQTAGRTEVLRASHVSDGKWDIVWKSAVSKGAGKWTAEIAMPLRDLGINPDKSRLIRANFARTRVTYTQSRRGGGDALNVRPEGSVWSPPKGYLDTPSLFGYIALADAEGKTPAVPAITEVKVPGLPGMPGIASPDVVPAKVRFDVRSDKPGRELPRFWDSINASRIQPDLFNQTYAKGYLTQIRCDTGWPRAARFEDGKFTGDFSSADAMYDMLKNNNILAVVTLRARPAGIEYQTRDDPRWGRVPGPPKNKQDYQLLYNAYRAYFQHVYDRYGKEYFDSLRFEFWNEPDGSDRFFAGTVDDYFNWYAWVAKALKDVSPTGRIGGPAVTGGGFGFMKDFLEKCRHGANPATGGKGAPLDFVSFHVYGWRSQLTPGALSDPINTFGKFWQIMHDTGFGGKEVQVSEWGIEPTGNATGPYYWFRKTHYAPVWMAKLVKEADDATQTYADLKARIDGLSLCVFSGGIESEPFAGSRTLFISKWVPKPYFNGYIILNELGNERLTVDGPAQGRIGCMATKRKDGSLAVLVFHFKEYAQISPPTEDITVELGGLPVKGKSVSQMRVDENTSNSYTAWVKMGSPAVITDDIAAKLIEAAKVNRTQLPADADGVVRIKMPVNSVAVVIVD